MLPDKIYNILKWVSLVGLPAIITFYGVLGTTLNIPYVQQTLTIAIAFNTMLGTMLGVSSVSYAKKKGTE